MNRILKSLLLSMTVTLESAFAATNKLCFDFLEYDKKYRSHEYSETQARTDFIDKFFTALGWDVGHHVQKNPYEQEVKVEANVHVGTSQKRADYAFFVAPNYNDVRFYVEAKRPSGILRSADNYFQTIRYGWNSSTPVAVLTDFQQLHILDCRYIPDIDTALERCTVKFHFSDYQNIEKFAEIYYLLSYEAVAGGALERYAEALPKRRGKAVQRGLFKGGYQSIDDVFIHDLDLMRETLAKSLKVKNNDLNGSDLTEITQRILDRLIFLRFLEDKFIETGERVARFGDRGTVWEDFLAASHRLDARYNGVVFKPHRRIDNDPNFIVDDSVFGKICEDLSDVNSPYDFNAIPIHILGSIYERFLGKVITTTDKRARLVEKPEVRKAGGVYYTPEYVVRYIVEKSVGRLIRNKSPAQIAEMRFADIACGSGSFLLGIYDNLLRYHLIWYNRVGTDKEKFIRNGSCYRDEYGSLHLTLAKRREILINNIYGVDIDNQAVEVAQLSLYLKLLEEETTASARNYQTEMGIAILPSLGKNIVNGNSLIGTDILDQEDLFELDAEEQLQLHPMDFPHRFSTIFATSGGFDAVIGNPPYDVLEKQRGESSWPHHRLSEYANSKPEYADGLGGKLNLYRFFVIRMLQLTKDQGRVGMIVPNSLLADISCARTRQHLILGASEIEMDCFPQKDNAKKRIFADAKLSTVVVSGKKQSGIKEKNASLLVRVYPWNKFDDITSTCELAYKDVSSLDPKNLPIPMVGQAAWQICKQIHRSKKVIRLGELKEFVVNRGEINQTIFRKYITAEKTFARLIKGAEVNRYVENKTLKQGIKEFFNEGLFHSTNEPKVIAKTRRIATQRITGVDEYRRVVGTIVEPLCYFADSTNSISVRPQSKYALEYLLAILNSSLVQWRFSLTSTNNNVGTNELNSLPIRAIDFSIPAEHDAHDKIVKLVKRLTRAKIDLLEAMSDRVADYHQHQVSGLEERLETAIYELYDLSDESVSEILRMKPRSKT